MSFLIDNWVEFIETFNATRHQITWDMASDVILGAYYGLLMTASRLPFQAALSIAALRLLNPIKPMKPVPNSQKAAGMGTGESVSSEITESP